MLLNYFEQIEGYKVYITSANIEGLVSIPYNAVKEEEYPLITEKENHLRVFTNKWEYLPNYVDTKFYHKSTRKEKKYEIGETPDLDTYTNISPLENEPFQKWDEVSISWIIDEEAKNLQQLQIRQSSIQRLLLESDYIELPSFLERKGQEIYNQWMTYRANLRSAYYDPTLPLPEAPQ